MPHSSRPSAAIDDSSAITYDPSTSGMVADDVQEAIDELFTIVDTITLTPGPAGPQGPAGADGLMGPQGPQGPSGVVAATAPILYSDNTVSIDESGFVHKTGVETIAGTKTFTASTAASPGLVVRGADGQTANLTEWRDHAGMLLASISADATILTMPTAFAIGYGYHGTPGDFSVAIGHDASASGVSSVSIGDNPTANGVSAVGIGDGARANGPRSVALGHDASASAQDSVTLGGMAWAPFASAVGVFSNSSHPNSTAIGQRATTTEADQIMMGTSLQYVMFPGNLVMSGDSSAATRKVAQLVRTWADATDASRKGRLSLSVADYVGMKEGLRIEADGTNPRIGFLGSNAIARPSGDIGSALESLGLMTSATLDASKVAGHVTPYRFGASGMITTGSKPPMHRVRVAGTAIRLDMTLASGTASAAIEVSTDNGVTWPTTIGPVAVASGKSGTASVSTSLPADALIRVNYTAAVAASDPVVTLYLKDIET